jgi:predicted DNA-binding transcriptional regulator AlpA
MRPKTPTYYCIIIHNLKKIMMIQEISFEMMPNVLATMRGDLAEIKKMLFEKEATVKKESDRKFNLTETATFLDLAPITVYSLVAKRSIPHLKVGRRLYFLEADLIEWIKQGRRKTQTELAADAQKFIHHKKKRA